MASAKRSGFGDWDKGETGFHDVGLGLRLQQQQTDVFSRSGEGFTRMTFTTGQRQELERQTMIYKYMMASMPVPPELLIPLTKYPPMTLPQLLQNDQPSNKKTLNGRGGGAGGGDPEPWRCRRTDGKKWRCSRDVAPDQKYCERHSHKGRPSARSRKPVESSSLHVSHNNNNNNHPTSSSSSSLSSTTTTANTSNPIILNPFQHHPSSSFDLLPSSLPQYNHQPTTRYPEWFMKEEIVPAAHSLYPQQMEHLAGETAGNASQLTHTTSDQTTRLLPRPFIDAWSLEDVHKVANPNRNPDPTSPHRNVSLPTEVTSNHKCHTSSSINSILPLTLSVSAGLDDTDNGRSDHKDDDDHAIRDIRSAHQQPASWMPSWINLPPGGPLAEALCLGMSGTANAWANHSDELVSPHGHSSGSSSTTMSSKGSHASVDYQGFQLH